MQQKLKSLLRKTSSRKKDQQVQHAKHDSGTATSNGRPSGTSSSIRNRVSVALSGRGSTSSDLQRPLSVRHEPSATATDYDLPSPGDIDQSVAENYRAYLPAISPAVDVSRDSRYMSLGGDSRHITGTSEMKHSEDIADRNIDMYGSVSRHGSSPSQGEVQALKNPMGKPAFSYITNAHFVGQFLGSFQGPYPRRLPISMYNC